MDAGWASVETLRRFHPKQHGHIMQALTQLANVYASQGKHVDALNIREEIFAGRKNYDGPGTRPRGNLCLGETTARLSVVPEGQALEEPSPEIGAAAPADFAESFAPPSDSPSQLAAAAPDEDSIGPEDPSSDSVPDDAVSGEPQPAAATVSLADADFDTGRAVVPESTLGGETTCIVCFTRPKTHIAVPCGHQCACGACADRMRECPYCREPVMMWMLQRLV